MTLRPRQRGKSVDFPNRHRPSHRLYTVFYTVFIALCIYYFFQYCIGRKEFGDFSIPLNLQAKMELYGQYAILFRHLLFFRRQHIDNCLFLKPCI